MHPILKIENVNKDFILHHQHSTRLAVLDDFSMDFFKGESTILTGPSGSGKSTLLRMIYGGYRIGSGHILVQHKGGYVDMAQASPIEIYDIRRHTIGYVSQFLRVVPRVSALDTVIEPLLDRGVNEETAVKQGKRLLTKLRIPENLWNLSATTFSGGEQQRINLARGFIAPFPVMLLDEPTASLDPKNRQTVLELIHEALDNKSTIIGVFHNTDDQKKIGGHIVDMFKKQYRKMEA